MVGVIYNGFSGKGEGGPRSDRRAGALLNGMNMTVVVDG